MARVKAPFEIVSWPVFENIQIIGVYGYRGKTDKAHVQDKFIVPLQEERVSEEDKESSKVKEEVCSSR